MTSSPLPKNTCSSSLRPNLNPPHHHPKNVFSTLFCYQIQPRGSGGEMMVDPALASMSTEAESSASFASASASFGGGGGSEDNSAPKSSGGNGGGNDSWW